jgi:hypothetical protein
MAFDTAANRINELEQQLKLAIDLVSDAVGFMGGEGQPEYRDELARFSPLTAGVLVAIAIRDAR